MKGADCVWFGQRKSHKAANTCVRATAGLLQGVPGRLLLQVSGQWHWRMRSTRDLGVKFIHMLSTQVAHTLKMHAPMTASSTRSSGFGASQNPGARGCERITMALRVCLEA